MRQRFGLRIMSSLDLRLTIKIQVEDKNMTETERYLFDLNGYLVVSGALSPQEVDDINAVVDRVLPDWHVKAKSGHIVTGWDEETMKDENTDPSKNAVGLYAGRLLDWGEPIRNLVGHETILPYMIE